MPSTIDEVEELDDLYAISKSFGLSTKGCKGVDDLKAKLCEYLQGLEGSSKRKVGNVGRNSSVYMHHFLLSRIRVRRSKLTTNRNGFN